MQENAVSRKKKSVRQIEAAFLDLIDEYPIEKITVQMICDKADLNRSSFYRNYCDIYDLMDSLVDDTFRSLFADPVTEAGKSRSQSFHDAAYDIILRMCARTAENVRLYQVLLFGRNHTDLQQKITQSLTDMFLGAHETSSYTPSPDTVLYYTFLSSGIIGLWAQWIREGCIRPREQVAQAAFNLIEGFFNKMNDLFKS